MRTSNNYFFILPIQITVKGMERLDDGEAVEPVLADVLGPDGSCAAYLLVAIDVLVLARNSGHSTIGVMV